MRVLSLCLALVMAALVWLPAQDIYWHPQFPSTDGNAETNWSTDAGAYVPLAPGPIPADSHLHFTGVGANADDCTFTASLIVAALTTNDALTSTITIGPGNTLTVSGSVTMDEATSLSSDGTLRSTGTGVTLTLPSAQDLPSLAIEGTASLANAIDDPLVLDSGNGLSLAPAAELTLDTELILQGGASLDPDPGTITGSNALVWRQTIDFPASSGLIVTAPVRIEQAETASTVIALPAWDFGGTLTFVAHADAVGLPDLHVTLLGAVAATDIDFTTLTANTEIRVFFADATARLTASGDLGASGNYVLVAFEAAGFPITLHADSMSFTNPFTSVDFIFGVAESADLVVNTAIDMTSSGSTSGDLFLELSGPGDGVGDVSLTLPDRIWDILKTGGASRVRFEESASVRRFTTNSAVATDITGALSDTTLSLPDGSQLRVADTGSTNGGARFALDLSFDSLSTHTVTNETDDAILELAANIFGSEDTNTDLVVDDGHVRISGTDHRPGDGFSARSFTYIDGSGTIVEYLGNGFSVDVVARGDDVQLRGTGQVLSFASEALDPVAILPGDDAGTFGILTIDNADLRSASGASDEVELRLKISGDAGAGIDYSRLATTQLLIEAGRTRLDLDLSDWSQDDATVSGIITYTASITGDPLALSLNVIAPSDVSVELIHDTLNQQIDLIVTVDDGSVTPPPVAGVFRTPSIPVSTRRSTLWTAVCPGTVEGLDDLRTKLAGRDANETRAFTWDPSTQAYVEFPAEPVGGVEPWHGWFIATTVPLRLDFRGTFEVPTHRVPLQAGWNLVGVGPVSDEVDVTRFPLTSLELRDGLDATLTGGDRSAVIGSTVAGWTTDGYRNVADFTSGRAYWVFNADAADHDLVYVAGTLIPVDVTSVAAAAAMPTPPAPPDLGGSKAEADGGSCGDGSAFGFLVLLVAFSGLRRQRMLRP